MKDLQDQVRLFCLHHGLVAPPEHRLMDVQSELGEVAKEILKETEYGKRGWTQASDDATSEMGDLLFSVIALANAMHVDLETALRNVLAKYEKRLKKGGAGSNFEG